MSHYSPYACRYETYENGTAKPRPVPEAILSLSDPVQRQQAETAWRSASRLFRLIDQWQSWFLELGTTGDADAGFAFVLDLAVKMSAKNLFALGLHELPEREILRGFPIPPSGSLEPPWQKDEEWFNQTCDRLHKLCFGK